MATRLILRKGGEASGVLFMVMTTLGGMAVAFASTGFELLETSGRTPAAAIELLLRILAGGLLVATLAAYARPFARQREKVANTDVQRTAAA